MARYTSYTKRYRVRKGYRRRRKRGGRRTYRRRRFSGRRNRRTAIGFTGKFKGIGFPDVLRMSLSYVDTKDWTPGVLADGTNAYIFRGNSIFDPDLTGTGHQPKYHDLLTGVYARYKVTSSQISLTMLNNPANETSRYLVLPHTSSTLGLGAASFNDLLENNSLRHKQQTNPQAARRSNIRSFISTRAALGYQYSTDEKLTAPFGTNPDQQFFWHCYFLNDDGSIAIAGNQRVQVRMRFWVTLFQRDFEEAS